jgi:vacuolar-type H+-ATPase subunit I/STV1
MNRLLLKRNRLAFKTFSFPSLFSQIVGIICLLTGILLFFYNYGISISILLSIICPVIFILNITSLVIIVDKKEGTLVLKYTSLYGKNIQEYGILEVTSVKVNQLFKHKKSSFYNIKIHLLSGKSLDINCMSPSEIPSCKDLESDLRYFLDL